jgi:replicative DNA helicase
MIFIVGRPSQGKTTIALNMTGSLALSGVPVAWINMDMQTKGRLFQRLVVWLAGVSLPKLKGGYARKDQLAKMQEAADRLKKAPIHVLDTENNLDVICAWIRMQVLKFGVKCVAIDYIQQIMTGDMRTDSSNNINARLTLVSAKLKKLQGELGIPFLVLTQLSRNADKEDRIPTLSDLRDSGSLEQDAFQVLLTYRNKQWSFDMEQDYHYRAQWIDLAKYQDGETGSVEFQFYAPYFSFKEAPAGLFDGLPNSMPPKVEYGKGHGTAEGVRRPEEHTGALPEIF